MLRFIVFTLSVAIAMELYLIYGGNKSGLTNALIGMGMALSLLAACIVLYGSMSDRKHQMHHDDTKVAFQFYPANNPNAKLSFVLTPGMLNSGEIVYHQLVGRFTQYGSVLVVNWPRNGFDGNEIAGIIADRMASQSMVNPIFVGQSLGSLMDMQVMEEYIRRGSPGGPIQGFLGDSAFTGAYDAKMPAPPFLADLIRDLPGQSLYWPAIAKVQGKSGVKKMVPLTESGVNQELIDSHVSFLNHNTFYSVAAQGRYIVDFQAPPAGAFAAVPALFLQTPNLTAAKPGDVLLQEGQALAHLQQIFPNSTAINVGGIHGNTVERPEEHWAAYEPFIQKCLARQMARSLSQNPNYDPNSTGS